MVPADTTGVHTAVVNNTVRQRGQCRRSRDPTVPPNNAAAPSWLIGPMPPRIAPSITAAEPAITTVRVRLRTARTTMTTVDRSWKNVPNASSRPMAAEVNTNAATAAASATSPGVELARAGLTSVRRFSTRRMIGTVGTAAMSMRWTMCSVLAD